MQGASPTILAVDCVSVQHDVEFGSAELCCRVAMLQSNRGLKTSTCEDIGLAELQASTQARESLCGAG